MRMPIIFPKSRVLDAANRAVACLGTGVHPVTWKGGQQVVTVSLPKLAEFRGQRMDSTFSLCGNFHLAGYRPRDSALKPTALCDAVLLRGADAYLPAWDDGPKQAFKELLPVEMQFDAKKSEWHAIFWAHRATVPLMREVPFPHVVPDTYFTALPADQLAGLQRAVFLEWAALNPRTARWGAGALAGHVVSSELAVSQLEAMQRPL